MGRSGDDAGKGGKVAGGGGKGAGKGGGKGAGEGGNAGGEAGPGWLRPELPWRHTRDPWAILVSEVMAQQTQVARVIPVFERFMDRFPTPSDCAEAPLGDVLRAWAGLGYNRRARFLHRHGSGHRGHHNGDVPDTLEDCSPSPASALIPLGR